MANTKQAGRPARPASLPRLTVARFREVTLLVERLVDEHTDAFIAAGQRFRDKHRKGTSRPLDTFEVAQVAAAMGGTLADAADEIQAAGLTHHDEPAQQEYLLAAGVATAPAFLTSALRVTALLEMPEDQFEAARERDTLDMAIDEAVRELENLDLEEARVRAAAAFEHLAAKAGADVGKGLNLIARTVWQALHQAMRHLQTTTSPETSLTASSMSSPASITGDDETSSMTSSGLRPVA